MDMREILVRVWSDGFEAHQIKAKNGFDSNKWLVKDCCWARGMEKQMDMSIFNDFKMTGLAGRNSMVIEQA